MKETRKQREQEAFPKKFTISIITIKEIRGETPRIENDFPWADSMPRLFEKIAEIAKYKILLMGPSTFQALKKHGVSEKQILYNQKNHISVILTRNKKFSIKEPPINVLFSLKEINDFWDIYHALEKIKFEKKHRERDKLTANEDNDALLFFPADKTTEPEIVVFGGQKLYHRMLPYAKTLHALLIYEELPSDILFPVPNAKEWQQSKNEISEYRPDDKNKYLFLHVPFRRDTAPKILLRTS